MTDPKDPHGDEHIEDLLSQLQGIFGRLSSSEEEEAKQKQDVPATAPIPTLPESAPVPSSEPAVAEPAPTVPASEDPAPPAAPESVPPPMTTVSEPMPVPSPAAEAPPPQLVPAEVVIQASDDPSVLTTLIFYPAGRENESKALAQKLEVLTPKFTKVAFHIHVAANVAYDPKSDWKDALIAKASSVGLKAIFVIMDRPLDEVRRKPLVSLLESKGVYFQDVPLPSIEKKAFYTDLLLGLVFFVDTMKPPTENPS